MARVFSGQILTAIDVGTTKICVLVAHRLDDIQVEVIGIGVVPSEGLRKGVVVDVAKTIYAIKTAIREAELMAGVTIESAYIGISGGHIQSINSHGMVPIKRGYVETEDIANVLASARAVPIPEGKHILHVLPKYFVIDAETRIHNPIGMHGVRLEIYAHMVLGDITSVQNLIKCCEMAGVHVNDIILEQLASADAVLSNDERELGVMMIDIGGGTSDVAIYQHGSIRHTMVLPVAGNHFTHDLAIGLRTTIEEAEHIKKIYGSVDMHIFDKQGQCIEITTVQGVEKQYIQSNDLLRIMQPRAKELFSIINQEIIRYSLHSYMVTGVVLTGGGSMLKGMQPLAQEVFNMPVRLGVPRVPFSITDSLCNPIYATGYGLLMYTINKQHDAIAHDNGPLVKRVFEKMRSWVLDFF